MANDFHIATSNALDVPRKVWRGGGEKSIWSCDLKNTNKQAYKQISETRCQVAQEHVFVVFAARDEKQR